jgi:hypothetical protein
MGDVILGAQTRGVELQPAIEVTCKRGKGGEHLLLPVGQLRALAVCHAQGHDAREHGERSFALLDAAMRFLHLAGAERGVAINRKKGC